MVTTIKITKERFDKIYEGFFYHNNPKEIIPTYTDKGLFATVEYLNGTIIEYEILDYENI